MYQAETVFDIRTANHLSANSFSVPTLSYIFLSQHLMFEILKSKSLIRLNVKLDLMFKMLQIKLGLQCIKLKQSSTFKQPRI